MNDARTSPLSGTPRLSLVDSTREESFPSLCLVHAGALSRLARLLMGSEADAQDLVQDTYLHAWERFPQLRDRTLARNWLFRILRHLALERLRGRRRRTRLLDVASLEPSHADLVPAETETALDRLEAQATRDGVRDAIRRLPEHYGSVVEHHDLHGLKYREVADRLAIPIGTVMSRLNRGRAMLAEMLVEPALARAA